MSRKPPRIVNLDLPDAELAAQFGVKLTAIAKVRTLLSSPKSWRFHGVDWSKSNGQIAKELGCTYAVARHGRDYHGKPNRQKAPRGWAAKADWSKTNAQLAGELGISANAVAIARWNTKRAARRPRSETQEFPQHAAVPGNIDWRLRDMDIAAIYGVLSGDVGQARKKQRAPLPLFVERKVTPERSQARAAQQAIADAWFARATKLG